MRASFLALFLFTIDVLASRHPRVGPKQKRYPSNELINFAIEDAGPEKRSAQDVLVTPRFFIVSLFTNEANVWYKNMPSLKQLKIPVPGISPLFPKVFCTGDGNVCQITLGEGEINAASSMSALLYSNRFDLTSTYFMVAGIAGINPHVATTGSVTFARYAVQVDLQSKNNTIDEFDARQIPTNWSSGYVPQNSYEPDTASPSDYPGEIYGTEVFELNLALHNRFMTIAQRQTLSDSDSAQAYRSTFGYAPANQPPSVVACDTVTSNVYWSGSRLGDAFTAYTKLLTNGTGLYCASQQEDNAVLEALLRGDLAGKVDFTRIAIMRTASDFDRAPPTETEVYHLLYADQAGFGISIENIFVAGAPIVKDVLTNWDEVYKNGVKPGNWIGDVFNSLKRKGADIPTV